MIKYTHFFKDFLHSLKTENNTKLLESIEHGFNCIYESLSTDDANKPIEIDTLGPSPVIQGSPESESEEYFTRTLPEDKLNIVNQSQFGIGRIALRPAAGRSITPNDPMKNQYGVNQNTTGGIN